MSNYSEQDTERARAAERSSAGMATQALPDLPAGYAAAAPASPARQNNRVALAMIGVGVLMLLSNLLGSVGSSLGGVDIEPGIILLTIGSVFLFFSFWRRIYGLLIPGCILAGLSAGVALADITDGFSVLFGLAMGFFAIYGLGRNMFGMRHPWPVIPGIIMSAIGVMVAALTAPSVFGMGALWLPIVLIGAGLVLGRQRG